MSAIVLASGIVRAVRPLAYGRNHERAGEVIGTEVNLMTQVGDVYGETLKVSSFSRADEDAWNPQPGSEVSVIVEVDSGRYGLSGVFKRHATKDDLAKMPLGVPTLEVAGAKG